MPYAVLDSSVRLTDTIQIAQMIPALLLWLVGVSSFNSKVTNSLSKFKQLNGTIAFTDPSG